MRFLFERLATPISELLIVADDSGVLRALEFVDHESRMHRLLQLHYGSYMLNEDRVDASITKILRDYFEGNLAALEDLPVATKGTAFQREVWKALRTIPPGATLSYGQLAEQIGRAGASRAVGAANGANPIAIVVPCHRVIGSNGTLTGYASGLSYKKWLLDHERRYAMASVN